MRYHKVQGSDNNAGVFTEELDHDGAVRHTEVCEVRFRFGRDAIALHRQQHERKSEHRDLCTWRRDQVETHGRMDA